MDSEQEKKFSFPNSDRYDPNAKQQAPDLNQPRPVVHITDALNIVPKKENGVEPNIRTFQADIADAIKNDNVSMIQMALSEKKRQEKRGNFEQAVETRKNNTLFYTASIGIAVVILILFSAFIVFMTSKGGVTNTVASNAQITEPLIYTEESIALSTDNRDSDDIESLIKKEKEVKLELGAMKSILLTSGSGTSTQLLNTGGFLALVKARVSDSLIRALDDNFLLGIYSFNPYDTFMVFKVNSYDNAFAGMLQWENSMESDIGGLVITKRVTLAQPVAAVPVSVVVASSTGKTATSTTTTQVGGFKRHVFIDKVVQNKDSRVLIDERGAILMLYSFLDKNTLVVASSDKALKEVLFRLTTGRIVR